ncbi:hypothetical protein C1701_01650 [Actinoalloteichus sp. AHMU CJ021]|uniref:Uncharacterized protein n=1 Tax=Actinoalloteichus caeruleus DSM 43889 TaxID=1120930 RepID=A0ABT1JF27_ACTCY|nr:hypothetical protein [Actinoalloteichus caeruleus]AUS77287.1 hypothetical protein C1701_01650 [Actinoalloteichus sp. AHMU CJ021]MCP2331086.1 hypothetical protein [Actinoalloteichus caeruleus DSM 43889]
MDTLPERQGIEGNDQEKGWLEGLTDYLVALAGTARWLGCGLEEVRRLLASAATAVARLVGVVGATCPRAPGCEPALRSGGMVHAATHTVAVIRSFVPAATALAAPR